MQPQWSPARRNDLHGACARADRGGGALSSASDGRGTIATNACASPAARACGRRRLAGVGSLRGDPSTVACRPHVAFDVRACRWSSTRRRALLADREGGLLVGGEPHDARLARSIDWAFYDAMRARWWPRPSPSIWSCARSVATIDTLPPPADRGPLSQRGHAHRGRHGRLAGWPRDDGVRARRVEPIWPSRPTISWTCPVGHGTLRRRRRSRSRPNRSRCPPPRGRTSRTTRPGAGGSSSPSAAAPPPRPPQPDRATELTAVDALDLAGRLGAWIIGPVQAISDYGRETRCRSSRQRPARPILGE